MRQRITTLMLAIVCAGFTAAAATGQEKSGSTSKSAEPHKIGDKASDFELQSIGKTIKLSDHYGKDGKSAVVVFSRASW